MAEGKVHIYTGEGTGPTTAAIGLAVRAAGSGMRVLVVQFFKEDSAPSGEKDFLRKAGIELVRTNVRHPFFTGDKTDEVKLRASIDEAYAMIKERASSLDMVVMDEAVGAIRDGYIDLDDFLDFLDNRPPSLEVVLTGRDAPVSLVSRADYVTEMLKIKHPFDTGTAARKGIEF